MRSASALSRTCSIAFKEWSGICVALAEGRQSLIVRKGGISEDSGRFVPEHDVFWLYPTHLHEAQQGLRIEPPSPGERAAPTSHVEIAALAEVVAIYYIDQIEVLGNLSDLHVWAEETIRRRFQYRTPGLWALGVRVYRRADPWLLDVTPAHAGCKSWVPLEVALPTTGLVPALGAAEFERCMERLRAAVQPSAEPRA